MAIIIQHPSIAGQQNQSSTIRELPIGDSKYLQHVRYDSSTLQLTVTMKNGAQYIHWYVYPATFEEMIQSPSKGAFYSKAIKGKNPSTKVVNKSTGPAHRKVYRKGETQHGRAEIRTG